MRTCTNRCGSENVIFGTDLEIKQNISISPPVSYLYFFLVERKPEFDCEEVIFFNISCGHSFVKSLFVVPPVLLKSKDSSLKSTVVPLEAVISFHEVGTRPQAVVQ